MTESGYIPNFRLPDNLVAGESTTKGNNCLIHSLLQAASSEVYAASNDAERDDIIKRRHEQICDQARAHLAFRYNCPESAFLELDAWWARILETLGRNPADYTITCDTAAHGAVHCGRGEKKLFIRISRVK